MNPFRSILAASLLAVPSLRAQLAGGGFSFTNGIIPEESERCFRLRTP
jgi:hypothetical protein